MLDKKEFVNKIDIEFREDRMQEYNMDYELLYSLENMFDSLRQGELKLLKCILRN